jgi:hypothetical protein
MFSDAEYVYVTASLRPATAHQLSSTDFMLKNVSFPLILFLLLLTFLFARLMKLLIICINNLDDTPHTRIAQLVQ